MQLSPIKLVHPVCRYIEWTNSWVQQRGSARVWKLTDKNSLFPVRKQKGRAATTSHQLISGGRSAAYFVEMNMQQYSIRLERPQNEAHELWWENMEILGWVGFIQLALEQSRLISCPRIVGILTWTRT